MTFDEQTVRSLCRLLERAWCRETSSVPDEWHEANPARGQCAVTALVLQDIFGGELVRTTVAGESHYLNRFSDEGDVDCTWQQFASKAGAFPYEIVPPEPRSREYVLSYANTALRYAILKARLMRVMAG